VYQWRWWFALASGYDWRSLGGKRKITWMVIANKSGEEKKTKEILYTAVIFLGEFSHCGYKIFFEEIGKIRFNSLSSREKCSKNGKNGQCLQTAKLRKKEKEKENTGTEIYMCAL
jgi:hypothetical protein